MPFDTAIHGRDSGRLATSVGPDVAILDASMPAEWVRAGHSTVVRVTVAPLERRSDAAFRVTHDGTHVATRNVTVSAASRVTIEFEVVFEAPASGVVAVNGVRAGELTVATATDDDASRTADEPTGQNWFVVLTGLIAVFVSILWMGPTVRARF